MGFPLDRALREMDPEEATAFVADVWAKCGWETTTDGPAVTATRAGETRQFLVCHDGSTDANAGFDAVVSTGNDERAAALADRCGAELVDVTDLYRRFTYGMSVGERDQLVDRYIDAAEVTVPESAEETATTNQSDERTAATRSTESETTTESDDETRTAAERTTESARTRESTLERDPTSDDGDESGRTTGIDISRRVAAVAVLLALLAVGSAVTLGVAPGGQASAGEAATTEAGDPATNGSGNADRDNMSSVTTGTDRDGQRRYVGLAPTCNRPPELVVQIQLGALRQNDETLNKGIRTVWRFASPENQRRTGPFSRFAELVNSSRYRPMFEYTRAEYTPVEIDNGTARQRVTLTTPDGSNATYEFHLARQSGGEYDGCWMTNAVTREDDNTTVVRQ